jgi:hypothetical protein
VDVAVVTDENTVLFRLVSRRRFLLVKKQRQRIWRLDGITNLTKALRTSIVLVQRWLDNGLWHDKGVHTRTRRTWIFVGLLLSLRKWWATPSSWRRTTTISVVLTLVASTTTIAAAITTVATIVATTTTTTAAAGAQSRHHCRFSSCKWITHSCVRN